MYAKKGFDKKYGCHALLKDIGIIKILVINRNTQSWKTQTTVVGLFGIVVPAQICLDKPGIGIPIGLISRE